ncbi:hypothetical protein DespoDRAFT_00003 [Desulfobacter postgatei 2ac9]|uniref:Uncharacterized protein n=1 Tax=Desulfobacter postgatei 2ac9 TaxID=879212 RepID=I5AXV8_9BACT|nr:hypothetical protein DespoDRAFT_00003 [Desulfobacter postgatei 2ac9]
MSKHPPLLEIVNIPWRDFLFSDIHKSEIELFRKHERTYLTVQTTFVKHLEAILDRRLRRKKKLVEITMSKVSPDFKGVPGF